MVERTSREQNGLYANGMVQQHQEEGGGAKKENAPLPRAVNVDANVASRDGADYDEEELKTLIEAIFVETLTFAEVEAEVIKLSRKHGVVLVRGSTKYTNDKGGKRPRQMTLVCQHVVPNAQKKHFRSNDTRDC
ncbi:unnamed protein product [Ascophyllum nodosum]